MESFIPLQNLITDLKKMRQSVAAELAHTPAGYLMITEKKDGFHYYDVSYKDGKRCCRSIGHDVRLVEQLARRRVLEEKLRRLDENTKLLQAAAVKSLPLEDADIIRTLPKYFETLGRDVLIGKPRTFDWPRPCRDGSVMPLTTLPLTTGGLSPREWATLPYCENTGYLEYKKYFNSRGVACRSKSEVAILEKYDAFPIPFHCDESFRIGRDSLAPDVIGARADGVLIYHEHFGGQDERYFQRRARKRWLYAAAGILPGKNLICTHDSEDGTIDMAAVETQIRSLFFPEG